MDISAAETLDSFLEVSAHEEVSSRTDVAELEVMPPCPKNSSTPHKMAPKKKTKTGLKETLCANCGKKYKSFGSYRIHIRRVHGLGKAAPYKCPVCEKSFFEVNEYQAHISSHSGTKPFRCDKCNATYTCRKAFKRHSCVRKPQALTCEVCQKVFSTKAYLSEHAHVHTRVQRFPCRRCQQPYKYRSSRAKHEQTCT